MPDPRRVLVVDDEEEVRVTISRLLERIGCTVEAVGHGEDAVIAVQARRPDLMVLDLAMPGVDGWTVIERLIPIGPPPIIVLSPRSDNPSDGPFQDCIVGFLFKPVHYGELIAACKRILNAKNPSVEALERRRHPRRRLVVDVTLLSHDENPVVVGKLVDLSAHGLQMEMDVQLGAGDPVRVILHVPGPNAQLVLEGTILWRNAAEQGFAYGVDLTDITADEARQLRAVVEVD
jgi:CheY-like chemotaxis protein